MRRPWYTYALLFVGSLALLGALFRPNAGGPGGTVTGPQGWLYVTPGSPLAYSGARSGDRFIGGETIEPAPGDPSGTRELRWRSGRPQAGDFEIIRGGRQIRLSIRRVASAAVVSIAWGILGLLNVALTILALALFWQRPRDGRAILLGLVLLAAPVFSYPREPRLLALALAAHFFWVFPPPPGAERKGIWRFRLLLGFYGPLLFFGLVGSGLWRDGRVPAANSLFNTMAVGYALFALARVLLRWRNASPEQGPVYRTLALAAGASLAAVVLGLSASQWMVRGQFVPANFVPALLFGAAMAHLVFRLRALEVRVMARQTLQYLLARWTLGTLFLIPGFLLVWRLGQLSASHAGGRPADVFPLLLWMFVTALLLGKRQEVLRNLDRRFFRDVEATRQALVRLAQNLGGLATAEAVLGTLEEGVREALHPRSVRFTLEDDAGILSVPLRRGDRVLGYLCLGPKESGEEYQSEERDLLEAAAVQAATALENARLNAALLDEQRARMAGVLAGAEEERRRLAADLHDEVLPELRQIAGEVERLRARSNGMAPDLERLEGEVRGTMDSVREVMEALRPSALDLLGLGDALESYLRKSAARHEPAVTVSVRRVGEEPDLTPEQSLGLYRICQEGINNALRHSGAGRVGLEMECDGRDLRLRVWDDGCGFEADTVGSGHGLGNLRYRADLIGASVEWRRRGEGGTEVSVRLTIEGAAAPPR